MKLRLSLLILLAMVILSVGANSVFAQGATASAQLNGTVTDESGAPVGNAPVALRNTDTNSTSTAVSNDKGFYFLPNLSPGHYELKVSYTGFAGFTQTGIVLSVGQSATINVTLQIASHGEKVVVTTEVQAIEPTKTEISQVVGAQQIQSLPISGRVFTDFALLTPGVATSRTSLGTTFTEFEVTQISFGGMRSFSNEITVDGADFVNALSGVQRATPPQDSVQEFRVVNNSFGAEYGRAIGGIVNIVTKSGTNELHGSAYDYFQNNATDSRSLLQPAPRPNVLRQNQFGATLGGPLSKDKMFFFINFEAKRRAESPTMAPDLYNNILNIDIAKAFMGLAPEGCNSCAPSPLLSLAQAQGYLSSSLKTGDNDFGFVRLDHQISANNHLAIRYLAEDVRSLNQLVGSTLDGGGIGTPSGGRNLFVRDQSLVGSLNSSFSNNLVNTATLQYARRHYNFPGSTGQPDLSVVNDLEFGHNFGTYDAIYESRMEGSDSISWIKGNHLAKFGFDGNFVWDMTNYPGFTPERIIFPNLDCLNAFGNAVSLWTTGALGSLPTSACPLPDNQQGIALVYYGLGLPRNNCPDLNTPCASGFYNGYSPQPATGGGFGSGWPNAFPTDMYSTYAYNLNHGYWGVYAQDQWRITPKLTFNYGLRWDYESGLGAHIDPYHNAFQPRVGLAYSPDSKTVVRAGYGMFFDRSNLTFFFTPGDQKTVPGFLCNGGSDPSCAGITPVAMPMVQSNAASAGWQLGATPGGAAAIPCFVLFSAPNCAGLPGGTVDAGAFTAFLILAGAPYPASTLTGTCNLGTGAGACGVGAGGMDRHNSKLPYAQQASLQISRQIGKGFSVELGYLFVAAHRLVRGNNLNVPCPQGTSKPGNPYDTQGWLNADGTVSPCSGTPTLGPLGLGPIFTALPLSNPTGSGACPMPYQTPFPFAPNSTGFACIGNPLGWEFSGAPFDNGLSAGLLDYNNDVANAVYHGLTVTGTERWGKHVNLTANYTYSHTIDNGNFTTFINLPPNQFDYSAERSNSNQDMRHHFVTNFTLSGPEHGFLRKMEFSSIITLQTGRPFTLYAGQNVLGDLAGSSTDRTGGPPVVPNCPSVEHCSTLIGRNTYIGPSLRTWDLRVSRAFRLTERIKLDLMMDAFNLLDRVNVDEVTSVYGPVFCGAPATIPHSYNDATSLAIQNGAVSCATQQAAANPLAWLSQGMLPVPIPNTPNPNFGLPRTVLNPRQFQFVVKFSF